MQKPLLRHPFPPPSQLVWVSTALAPRQWLSDQNMEWMGLLSLPMLFHAWPYCTNRLWIDLFYMRFIDLFFPKREKCFKSSSAIVSQVPSVMTQALPQKLVVLASTISSYTVQRDKGRVIDSMWVLREEIPNKLLCGERVRIEVLSVAELEYLWRIRSQSVHHVFWIKECNHAIVSISTTQKKKKKERLIMFSYRAVWTIFQLHTGLHTEQVWTKTLSNKEKKIVESLCMFGNDPLEYVNHYI